jgi:hypothetical protein
MLLISASIVFPPLSLVNHGPYTAFATWILLHCSFEKKNWRLKRAIYVGFMLHISATRVRLCKYTVYPYLFVLYYLRFPRDLHFLVVHTCVVQYGYGSPKEVCSNFAWSFENNTWSWEESWRETCGHCKTDADCKNILSLEKSCFQLRQNSA